MRRRRFNTKRIIIVCVSILSVMVAITLGISYYALSSLTFAGDRVFYGNKQSDLVNEIRTELSKRSDVSLVSFKTSDNITLSGFFVKRAHASANVVVCHGFRGAKELEYGFINSFPEWNLLIFDFRAHGQSEGKIITLGCHEYKDVIAASSFLRQLTATSHPHLPLIIAGISMGGSTVLRAVEQDPSICDAIIVDSAFSNLNKVMFDVFSSKTSLPTFPFLNITKVMLQYVAGCDIESMNPAQSVKKIKQPILFIHSRNDSYVVPENVVQLFANAQNKCSKVWVGPCCRHGWLHSYHTDLYKHKVESFLKKVLPNYTA